MEQSQFLKIELLANNPDFKTKVRMAALKAAGSVLADGGERVSEYPYFKHLIDAPLDTGWIMPICYQAAQNVSLLLQADEFGVNSSVDGDIEFTVNSVIGKFSVPLLVKAKSETKL